MNRDTLLFKLADICKETGVSPERAIQNLIKEEAVKDSFNINLRGSSLIAFESNPLHFAVLQFLKVYYGGNNNTIIGNAVHQGVDYSYKYKMANNKLPALRLSIKVLIENAKDNYKKINPDLREKYPLNELIKESVKYFKVYFKKIMPLSNAIASEESFKMDVPVEFLSNPNNYGKIKLTGTLDRLFQEDGLIILSDLKTSGKRISGNAEHPAELKKLTKECKALENSKSKLETELNKFEKLREKLHLLESEQSECIEVLRLIISSNLFALKLTKAKNEDERVKAVNESKSTTLIDKRIKKVDESIDELNILKNEYKIDLLTENLDVNIVSPKRIIAKIQKIKFTIVENTMLLDEFEIVQEKYEKNNSELDELFLKKEPLQKEYNQLKRNADLKAAKKQYGTQLAFYAIMYMVVYGVKIDKLRVEVIVKTDNPYEQVFTWELSEFIINRTTDMIQMVVSIIEGIISGIDPAMAFRLNTLSYIGEDTNNLVNELEDLIEEVA